MAAEVSTDPVDIQVDTEARELRIRWEDAHQSAYPFDLLRKACPCAVCREERRAADKSPFRVLSGQPLKAGETQVLAHRPVGRYALWFKWNDGHETGIYSFDMLREICPCDLCRQGIWGKNE